MTVGYCLEETQSFALELSITKVSRLNRRRRNLGCQRLLKAPLVRMLVRQELDCNNLRSDCNH